MHCVYLNVIVLCIFMFLVVVFFFFFFFFFFYCLWLSNSVPFLYNSKQQLLMIYIKPKFYFKRRLDLENDLIDNLMINNHLTIGLLVLPVLIISLKARQIKPDSHQPE